MSLLRKVILRHRSEGYLRFDLPQGLGAEAPSLLSEGLMTLDGVYRVRLEGDGRKLSVRFHPDFCRFEVLIVRLHALLRRAISRVTREPGFPSFSQGPSHPVSLDRPRVDTLIGWIKTRVEAIRETFMALKILFGRAVGHRPRWVKEFMNDLLMLFLIKLHWQHIINDWLPRPWTYRYEWAATLYLIYLSVQARAPRTA